MTRELSLFLCHTDNNFLEAACNLLDDFYVVHAATNGFEIVNDVLRLQPDVAVLDFNIPEIDVLELCQKLGGSFPELAIIIYVNHENLLLAKKKWRQRAIDYIVGPLDVMDFIEEIHKAVRYFIANRQLKNLMRVKTDFRHAININLEKFRKIIREAHERKEWNLVAMLIEEIDSFEQVIKDIDTL